MQAGQVQGEDYTFTFSGRLNDGKLNVELQMQYDGSDDDDDDEVTCPPIRSSTEIYSQPGLWVAQYAASSRKGRLLIRAGTIALLCSAGGQLTCRGSAVADH